ncbi:bifunctional [glutamate--ammonia ligase]-adenylyl-L-tyrosine phosphorylase/[glutamate--ammonia-ligase] adenylyltransferase [Paraferrimonas sedimenticola]|uniref:Bifunctional glutamine synthetase adenylyltransferase/adenylyl-removing enzyme n=1 Tax=Paraferrimonas sedimenticola TaxID=375674 RepID=A0AA37RUA0_9GAMM|nr:bifunctional [glutamate--ammonia ligase]-adenylyl-L-tyrosine phosphorylase/[glutamate--ammonia-ligase] adenylyltransferase [Paraferrimonas sedimenticola]GLP95670.1 glutamate-ammonia-ligase adenylyltransferase [Paraferrimonas sedimenticola]
MATDAVSNKPQFTLLESTKNQYWQELADKSGELIDSLAEQDARLLEAVLGASDFVAKQLLRNPHWIEVLLSEHGVHTNPDLSQYRAEITQVLAEVRDENSAKRVLRQFRNRQMCAIAWRDICNLATLQECMAQLSDLAEALILGARDWLVEEMKPGSGLPMAEDGSEQQLLVIGMGKLGGRELNFSSDIDLIFCFEQHGNTQGGRRSLENQAYFIRLAQRLVNLLHQVTADGFCYRVDMRLRPFGDSGPLVVSFQALEDYYQEQGRDWERYAMVKARVLGERCEQVSQLKELLRPFVYRRYLDFSAVDALRKMKQMIAQEVRRRQLTDNIKLGQGGIREVEFVVQSLQLIRGGREPSLRCQSLYLALEELQALGQLSAIHSQQLRASYDCLRRTENLLQAIDDRQTQTLPDNELDWQRLCQSMGYDSPQALREAIEQAMRSIHSIFLDTIGGEEEQEEQASWSQLLWQSSDSELALSVAQEALAEPESFVKALQGYQDQCERRRIGPRGRETLDKLMPALISDCANYGNAVQVFERVSKVLEQILTRTTYLELLQENPGARAQLLRLCQASPWITEQLSRFPILLDELIDPVLLYNPTALEDYPSELRQYLLRISEDDVEGQMEGLRQFKLAQQLKIAAADVTGVLPVMEVSDHLTYLAEAIIEQVVQLAWDQVAARHGAPQQLEPGETGFMVVAYGKAGGLELGYGSDLDLVFLHKAIVGQTDGDKRPLDTHHFYLKLAQRILHLFSTRTPSGILYEVDMRLRPSGASGLLVSELERFGEYQTQEAWVWEHQALCRARVVYGDSELTAGYNQIRQTVLTRGMDEATLRDEVVKMRAKMRDHLLDTKAEVDLKQGIGGITDVEFIAQYLVLKHAPSNPELCRWSDNVRILEDLAAAECLPVAQAQALINAYCELRDASHRSTLAGQGYRYPEAVTGAMEQVAEIWRGVLER